MLGAGRGYAVFEAGRIHNGWYVVLWWRRCEKGGGAGALSCALDGRYTSPHFAFRVQPKNFTQHQYPKWLQSDTHPPNVQPSLALMAHEKAHTSVVPQKIHYQKSL